MGTNLFAGTEVGVFLSVDTGSHWALVNNGMPNASIRTFTGSGTNLFVRVRYGLFFRRIAEIVGHK